MNNKVEVELALSTRQSFSLVNPLHQIAWDATSLSALKRCPRYYEYAIVRGYVPRAESAHLRFGQEYHAALECFEKAIAAGKDREEALLDAVEYAFAHTWDAELGRPWTSDEPTKTRETLIRSVIWYIDNFEHDTCETVILSSGKPAVELPFRMHLEINSALTGEGYLLCGYLDRIVTFQGGTWITDKKTSKMELNEKFFASFSPHTQMSQYTLAGTVIASTPIMGIIIDGAQMGVTFTRFQRACVTRTPAQLTEWLGDSVSYIRANETYVKAEYWPHNDAACGMYGGCPYRTVCAASPEIRPQLLRGLFHRRVWDPLLVREA